MDCGWGLALWRNERVLWMNEGPPPSAAELENNSPRLHNDGKGFMVCGVCGSILAIPQEQPGARGRRRAQQGQEDAFGHRRDCPQRGQPPVPAAIFADGFTEILRLVIPVPADLAADKHEVWGLSLGYSLRIGIRQFYMLDGTEIDFELEGPWGRTVNGQKINYVALSFIDATLGGTGYLPKVAADLNLVAKRAIAHLDHKNCDSACYRCLKTYANQRYHDKLQWPLAMPMLEALADQAPVVQRLEIGDTHDPKPWLDAFAAGVGSPLEHRFLRLFEQHGFKPEKQVPISVPDGTSPITVADFAVPTARLAIYVDGASIHAGHVLRRDRFIRGRLRECDKPWKVIELRASDLRRGAELVQHLKGLT
jgi:hypothetical protein